MSGGTIGLPFLDDNATLERPRARIADVRLPSHSEESRETVDPAIRDLVVKKSADWCRQLMDFTRRNRLLFFKHLKRGTLDLADAEPVAVRELLEGKSVSLRKLYPNADEATLADVRDRIRVIQAKKKENEEERSIKTLRLALDQLTWDDSLASTSKGSPGQPATPAAPLLLVPLEVSTNQGRDDYVLTAAVDDREVNPVLVEYLKSEMGFQLVPPAEAEMEADLPIAQQLARIRQRISTLRGGRIDSALTVGNFSYAKIAMVQDIQEDELALARHETIQALCNHPDAIAAIRGNYVDPPLDAPNHVPPADEFLILDADSSQNRIVNSAIQGHTFAFDGPPGTGKSQTIANMIAAMVARGKKVLFVAEKRAAIDVVLRRLNDVGLGDLVMDYHGTGHKKRELLDKIRVVLPTIHRSRVLVYGAPTLEQVRGRLVEHSNRLHGELASVGMSPYELLTLRSEHESLGKVGFVLGGASQMSMNDVKQLESEVKRFWELGGFVGGRGAAMWRRIPFRKEHEIDALVELLRKLDQETLTDLSEYREFAWSSLGKQATSNPDLLRIFELLAALYDAQNRHGHQMYLTEINQTYSDLERAQRFTHAVFLSIFSKTTRAARNKVRMLTGQKMSSHKAAKTAAEAIHLRSRWEAIADSRISVPDFRNSALSRRIFSAWRDLETTRATTMQLPELTSALGHDLTEAREIIRDLLSFTNSARSLREAREAEEQLNARGIERLIAISRERDLPLQAICSAVWLSWLDYFIPRHVLSSLTQESNQHSSLGQTAETFAVHDREHIARTPARILEVWRKNYREATERFPEQERALATALGRKRNIPPLKDIFGNSQDVICAIKPVWVMSPLSVSMLRPRAKSFDIVSFDEASQILPWDAVTAIKAARQVVVAGDDQQLPPTTFFAGGENDEVPDQDEPEVAEEAQLGDFESILSFLKSVVTRPLQLQWHYRSRDERLIKYSDEKIYRSLMTFADSTSETVLRYVRVPDGPEAISQGASNPAEVRVVCDLIADHIRRRPEETLGVIALGITHADAIESEIRRRRENDPALDGYLQSHTHEPFFVKNLERVQGDERDAIILSIGYGRGPDRQIRYNFGPINGKFGIRRLNVATTRSRNRMSVIATFSSDELQESKCASGGLAFLRGYLRYVETGGSDFGQTANPIEMNAFERSIYERLIAAGLDVEPQYGVGRYRIDFAVRSRTDRSRFALAVECDGASYHSQPTARERDRLRQTALERRGWRFHRIWSTDWFNDPDRCINNVLTALRDND